MPFNSQSGLSDNWNHEKKKMSPEMEKVICKVNTHKEICKLCCSNKQLEKELKGSLYQPTTLIEQIFQRLSLKDSNFKMFQQLTND